jgi:hypothetical protein
MSQVGVRYIIDDVPAAVRFYTTLLGFTLEHDASPAFAAVVRDGVRLLLSGDGSSRMGGSRRRGAGTGCIWWWMTWRRRWPGCGRRGFRFG